MNIFFRKLVYLLAVLALTNFFDKEIIAQENIELYKVKSELKTSLVNDILNIWYPKVIDTVYGGYLSDFDSEWKEAGDHHKMLVSQSRHVWTLSKMTEFLDDEEYKIYSKNGFDFLKSKLWDNINGGFYHIRDRKGDEITGYENEKQSYSLSFSIYGLAAYYKLSEDPEALELAQKTFMWLENYAHDKENKGYFNQLTEDGKLGELKKIKNGNSYNVNPTWKDQNSSIHLLEAFTELYSVWPDSLLKERLSEMLVTIRDVIVNNERSLTLFLENDWEPISFKDSSSTIREANVWLDHVSFGHDIETAFLMLEASHMLEIKGDVKTLSIAKKMVNHSLEQGWDKEKGGFYHMGYYFNESESSEILDSSKVWWVQAEGLNSLLLMSKLFPEENKYLDAFIQQWEYIKKYMIDHDKGGWYEKGLDYNPEYSKSHKAHIWKTTYHNVRALMHCIKMLEN